MPRALDETLLKLPFAERAAVVRANVVDGAPGPILAVAQAKALWTGVHDAYLADGHVLHARDRDELAQARTSS